MSYSDAHLLFSQMPWDRIKYDVQSSDDEEDGDNPDSVANLLADDSEDDERPQQPQNPAPSKNAGSERSSDDDGTRVNSSEVRLLTLSSFAFSKLLPQDPRPPDEEEEPEEPKPDEHPEEPEQLDDALPNPKPLEDTPDPDFLDDDDDGEADLEDVVARVLKARRVRELKKAATNIGLLFDDEEEDEPLVFEDVAPSNQASPSSRPPGPQTSPPVTPKQTASTRRPFTPVQPTPKRPAPNPDPDNMGEDDENTVQYIKRKRSREGAPRTTMPPPSAARAVPQSTRSTRSNTLLPPGPFLDPPATVSRKGRARK